VPFVINRLSGLIFILASCGVGPPPADSKDKLAFFSPAANLLAIMGSAPNFARLPDSRPCLPPPVTALAGGAEALPFLLRNSTRARLPPA